MAMATNVQILKELTRKATVVEMVWKGKVEGSTGVVENESHVVIPNVNTNDDPPALFSWTQLKNKLLVSNTFSANNLKLAICSSVGMFDMP